MKDHVQIGHLTKYDAFRVQNLYVSNFQTSYPKIILLILFYDFRNIL